MSEPTMCDWCGVSLLPHDAFVVVLVSDDATGLAEVTGIACPECVDEHHLNESPPAPLG